MDIKRMELLMGELRRRLPSRSDNENAMRSTMANLIEMILEEPPESPVQPTSTQEVSGADGEKVDADYQWSDGKGQCFRLCDRTDQGKMKLWVEGHQINESNRLRYFEYGSEQEALAYEIFTLAAKRNVTMACIHEIKRLAACIMRDHEVQDSVQKIFAECHKVFGAYETGILPNAPSHTLPADVVRDACLRVVKKRLQDLMIAKEKARLAGRDGVASHRQSGIETCERIHDGINALDLSAFYSHEVDGLQKLRSEISCRIEHGADSNGHLEGLWELFFKEYGRAITKQQEGVG